jgi:hypothetical protein
MKKIICISIIGLFLLSGFNVVGISVSNDIKNEDNIVNVESLENEIFVGEMKIDGEPHEYEQGDAVYSCTVFNIPDFVDVGFRDKVTLIVEYDLNPKGSNDKAICKIECNGKTATYETPDDNYRHKGELRLEVTIDEDHSYQIVLTLEWWDCWYENIFCPEKHLVGGDRKEAETNIETVDVQHDLWVEDFFISTRRNDWNKENIITKAYKGDRFFVHIIYNWMWPKDYVDGIDIEMKIDKPGNLDVYWSHTHIQASGSNEVKTKKFCLPPDVEPYGFLVDIFAIVKGEGPDYNVWVEASQAYEPDRDEDTSNNRDSIDLEIARAKIKSLKILEMYEKLLDRYSLLQQLLKL